MKQSWRFRRLTTVAFTSGFILMAFELIGARLLAPTIGSSTYVWTSVIGVIIAALSTGYFLGGKLADARNRSIDVVALCLAIALTIGMMLTTFDQTMAIVVAVFEDQRLRGVFASLVLFAPTSLLLGILSPYLVKLNVTSLLTSGQSVASLSAMNSIGGIVGTFVTGFIMFSYMGSRGALVIFAALGVISSWLFAPRVALKPRLLFSIATFVIIALPLLGQDQVVRIDTPSSHYEITTAQTTQPLRYLTTGPNAAQSGVLLNQPDKLAFWYTQEVARAVDLAPAKKSILVLGGGAFTLPEHFAREYPGSQIDVVEIDPHLSTIAAQYFNYSAPRNVRVISGDARAYTNITDKKYDIVVVDVYSDTSVPFSLLTKEFGQTLYRITTSSSTLLVNAIASQTGPCVPLLQAIDSAYRVVAPYALVSRDPSVQTGKRANLILAYTKQARSVKGMATLPALSGPIYTDNFMPAERLQQACQSAT